MALIHSGVYAKSVAPNVWSLALGLLVALFRFLLYGDINNKCRHRGGGLASAVWFLLLIHDLIAGHVRGVRYS